MTVEQIQNSESIKVFTLNSNPELAKKIAEHAGLKLGKLSSKQFSDGEIQINIEESVRGKDVYFIQSTSYPVNSHLWELLIAVDAAKRASAKNIVVVMPYFGYARQDRTAAPREPITAKLVANMLVKAGVTRVITLDLHAVQVQGFFDIPVDNLFTVPLFAQYYRQLGLFGDDVVVLAPKNSGIKRARSLAEYLESPIAIVDYTDDEQNRENGYIIGEVEGKKVIMIDDILNTGNTFKAAAQVARDAGATELYAVASHGLFTPGAADRLNEAGLKEILVTDSVETTTAKPDHIKYLSASELMADALVRIHEERPVSPLFQYDKNHH
jgi:ribose-phosphate pyrophosphokinase